MSWPSRGTQMLGFCGNIGRFTTLGPIFDLNDLKSFLCHFVIM